MLQTQPTEGTEPKPFTPVSAENQTVEAESPAGRIERTRLKPRKRGDSIARSLILAAFLLFLVAILGLRLAGVINFSPEGTDSTHQSLLSLINGLSLVLTVAGFIQSWMDLRWLKAEEEDIEFVLAGNGKENPRLVLYDDHKGKGQPRVKTLLDDRVFRLLGVGDTPPSIQLVHESELRALASWRSSTVGTFARYVSGLLLLLTILGTFIGVKSALAPLSTAIQGAVDPSQLAGPLQNVAAAFGSNLTALVGAIALGLAAFGLSLGRQSFLARLEQASSLYIYPRVEDRSPAARLSSAADKIGEVAASTKLLTQASIDMSLAAARVGDASQNVGSLSDAIQDLSDSVGNSLGQTREAIQALLAKQASQVADQSRQVVDRIERQLTDTTTSVQQATAVYATLVERLTAQQKSMDDSTIAMNAAVRELLETRLSFGRYVDDAKRVIDERMQLIVTSTDGIRDGVRDQLLAVKRANRRYRSIDTNLKELVQRAEALATKLAEDEARRHETAKDLDKKTADAVVTRLKAPLEAIAESARSIAEGAALIETTLSDVPEKLQDGVGRALKTTRLTVEVQPVPGSLETALEKLAGAVSRLESQLTRPPMWRRILRRGRA